MGIRLIYENEKEIREKAAQRLVRELKEHRKTLLLLSGGSAVKLYREIGKSIYRGDLGNRGDPGNLAVAQVDERFQPGVIASDRRERGDPTTIRGLLRRSAPRNDINSIAIAETGLWGACEKQGIPYYIISQEGTLKSSVKVYNRIMERLFREYTYKIAVLGIGEDGHTAGLIPGYKSLWDKERLVVGYELKNKQISNFKFQISKPKVNYRQRISLTPFALRQLDYAMVLAVGEGKREIVKKLKGDKGDRGDKGNKEVINEFPAKIILEIPRVDLFTTLL